MVVAIVGVLVYLPALSGGFTNWDDPGYVAENPYLGPLNPQFLAWAFTTFRQASWNPLTWLSLGVDHGLFGLDPMGYHLTNAVLHAATALIVVVLTGMMFVRKLGSSDSRGLVAAAVVGLTFVVHPLHVESVVWVSERKDVLYGFFYVLALLCYVRFTEQNKAAQYLATLGAFALALLAKPMAVSLPLVLFVLDAYPLARLTRPRWHRVFGEKMPFLVLAAASSVVTFVAQRRGDALARHIGIVDRFWVAERAFGFYLAKMALPINLVPMYPLESEISPWRWDYLLSLAIVLGATVAAVAVRRRIPLGSALWAAYLVMLLPATGVVLGQQAAADRHTYLALLAPAIGSAAVVVRVWRRGRNTQTVLVVAILAAVTSLAILTIRQIGVWRDTPTLWAWVIEKQPRAAMAYYNLGDYWREKGHLDRAGDYWRRTVEIEPSFSWPLNQLGNLAVLEGKLDEARSYYERATHANMHDAEAQLNFATFLEEQGEIAEARIHYENFLRIAPPRFAHLLPEVRAKLKQP